MFLCLSFSLFILWHKKYFNYFLIIGVNFPKHQSISRKPVRKFGTKIKFGIFRDGWKQNYFENDDSKNFRGKIWKINGVKSLDHPKTYPAIYLPNINFLGNETKISWSSGFNLHIMWAKKCPIFSFFVNFPPKIMHFSTKNWNFRSQNIT